MASAYKFNKIFVAEYLELLAYLRPYVVVLRMAPCKIVFESVDICEGKFFRYNLIDAVQNVHELSARPSIQIGLCTFAVKIRGGIVHIIFPRP